MQNQAEDLYFEGNIVQKPFIAPAALAALLLSLAGAPALASSESDALADCLYENTSSADRTVMVQWAYVTLGKTRAAKAVQAISDEKTKAAQNNDGTLYCAGMIAGEGLVGIALAILAVFEIDPLFARGFQRIYQ